MTKPDLDWQSQRCTDYATARVFEIEKGVKEVVSGMNWNELE
jgi:hypothetical protein